VISRARPMSDIQVKQTYTYRAVAEPPPASRKPPARRGFGHTCLARVTPASIYSRVITPRGLVRALQRVPN
jgi:hypothetical protein